MRTNKRSQTDGQYPSDADSWVQIRSRERTSTPRAMWTVRVCGTWVHPPHTYIRACRFLWTPCLPMCMHVMNQHIVVEQQEWQTTISSSMLHAMWMVRERVELKSILLTPVYVSMNVSLSASMYVLCHDCPGGGVGCDGKYHTLQWVDTWLLDFWCLLIPSHRLHVWI
jgi:hypothetical protein